MIRSNGLMERDFLYAEDAVAAYLAVARSLDRPELRGRAWNASIGCPVSVLEVVSGSSRSPAWSRAGRSRATGPRTASSSASGWTASAIAEKLGWKAEWDLQRGLRAT